MQSCGTKRKRSSTSSDIPESFLLVTPEQGHPTPDTPPDQKNKRSDRRITRSSSLLFSDPLDDTYSDTESFKEDEMYGSDHGGETFSLTPDSNMQAESLDEPEV